MQIHAADHLGRLEKVGAKTGSSMMNTMMGSTFSSGTCTFASAAASSAAADVVLIPHLRESRGENRADNLELVMSISLKSPQSLLPLHVLLAGADRCVKGDLVQRDPGMRHLAQEFQA